MQIEKTVAGVKAQVSASDWCRRWDIFMRVIKV